MKTFDVILGEQLSSVIFVQDYLQLDFDGNLMNFSVWPILKSRGLIITFPHSEYRNFLCEFITKRIALVNDIPDTIFEIIFEDNSSISIDYKYSSGEMLYFKFSDGNWGVIEK